MVSVMMIIREREERDVLLLTSSNGGQLQSKEMHKTRRERIAFGDDVSPSGTQHHF